MRQLAIQAGVVQAVADHESVGDDEHDERSVDVRVDLGDLASKLAHATGDPCRVDHRRDGPVQSKSRYLARGRPGQYLSHASAILRGLTHLLDATRSSFP